MSNKSLFDLTGRVAVITGASSGLGVQMAKAYARQGANIAIMARRKEKLEAVAAEIRTLGVKCLPVPCDVTDTNAIIDVVANDGLSSHKQCVYTYCSKASMAHQCQYGIDYKCGYEA
jgi:short-subunit dehydrogenase